MYHSSFGRNDGGVLEHTRLLRRPDSPHISLESPFSPYPSYADLSDPIFACVVLVLEAGYIFHLVTKQVRHIYVYLYDLLRSAVVVL